MKYLLPLAISAALVAIPTSAVAQQRGGVIVVDTDRILTDCTACRAAAAQLTSQQNTLRTRAQTLQQQLQTEGQPLQTAVNALNGRQPDAALKARIDAYAARERSAQQELQTGQRNLQSIQANVSQQLGNRLIQIVEQARARRGASIAIAKNGTIANDPAVDITAEVLAALNQQLPAVSVTPLPQQQQPQPPQSR